MPVKIKSRAALGSALTLVMVAITVSIIRPRTCTVYVPPTTRIDQGCINQGNDRRLAAPFVCWAQRHLSWKSEREPRLLLIGKPQQTHMGLAWPPYLVFNCPNRGGNWRVFRVGFRYDREWGGYIFPTAAWKCLPYPLRY
jgi:hypothetical protein